MNQLLDSSKRHDDVDIGKEEQPKILSQTLMIIPLGCSSSLISVMYDVQRVAQHLEATSRYSNENNFQRSITKFIYILK